MTDPDIEPKLGQTPTPRPDKRRIWAFVSVFVVAGILGAGITAVLVSIFRHKQEAREPYLKFVNVTESTTDPKVWGTNWPREYDGYVRTVDATRTRYGGSEAMPEQKLDRDPWLRRMFSGYAFAIDYRDRRGHAYMLKDQEQTERVTKKQQPGACLHCHASVMPLYRFVGKGDVFKGFEDVCAMPYQKAHDTVDEKGNRLVTHSVSCVDCHDPDNMELRVTRPAFIRGIKTLKASQGIDNYDPNRDATRQEMRTFVCGQCHVEYYFRGEGKLLTFPWANGLRIQDIEKYYETAGAEGKPFVDWKHGETGAAVLKAQHPEFELFSQGVHSQRGVACADCHMPYMRQGAIKVSDHWIRSPVLNISRACQTCHPRPESELKASVDLIQQRNHDLLQRSGKALVDMLDAIKSAKMAGAADGQLGFAYQMQRRGQWRLDFVYAENSMGFHAPQEAARILAESIDFFRQGQITAEQLRLRPIMNPATVPTTEPIRGVTPSELAPPGQ